MKPATHLVTRRQLLFAGAALATATACNSNDEAPVSTRNEVPAIPPPPVGPCGSDNDYDPEDWYKDHLAPTVYLIDPTGQDIDVGLPLVESAAKPRVNLHALDAATKDQLDAAYKALAEDLPADKPKVKESIGLQSLIHNRYCADSEHGVHRSAGGIFFAWHRAFLFFHERLLQWTLQHRCGVDAATARNFRLPYWDPREDFGVYGETARAGLFRMRGPRTPTPPKLIVADCTQTDLVMFGDRVLAWHGEVHRWLCGQFEQAKFSGFDPLFYAFHAYVDFIWESSPVKGQVEMDGNTGTKNIDPWWATFFDAGKANDPAQSNVGKQGWSKVDVNRFKDPAEWGYFYDGTVMCDANTSGLEFTNIDLPMSDDQIFRLVVRDLHNADDERELATIRPFGHVHKSYPFVRAYLPVDQAREYARTEKWGFWIRATYQQKPVSLGVKVKPVLTPP